MKKLFFSVFALSALMLSACSGNGDTPSSSAAGESSTQQSSSAQSSSAEASSSGEEESSSGEGSSSVAPVVQADYRVTIGTHTYDLVPNEGQTGHDKEYYLGENVSKTVAVGEKVSFEKLQNDAYSAFAVNPSPDAEDYNNVELVGSDYKIKVAGSVGVYLKLDGSDWSYWITGGGAAPDPFQSNYCIAYGTSETDPTWGFSTDRLGELVPSTDENVDKQLKFIFETATATEAKIRNSATENTEWYGSHYLENDPTEEDNNIALPAGKYEIYFKHYKDGHYSIWGAEYGPDTIKNLYYSINDGDPVAFKQEYHFQEGGYVNQFNFVEVELHTTDSLYIWKNAAGDQSASDYLDGVGGDTPLLLNNGYPFTVKNDGHYSFYLNEEEAGLLTLYATRKEGLPTTKVLFEVTKELESGKALYVTGEFCEWDAAAEYKLTEKEGHIWVVSASDATVGFNLPIGKMFKLVIADATNPGKDHSEYKYEADPARIVQNPQEKVTTWQTVPDGYYLAGEPVNGWGTRQESNKLVVDPGDANHYTINLSIAEGQKFKIVGVASEVEDWTKNNKDEGTNYTLDTEKNIVVSSDGTYTINFYVTAANDNHVTLDKLSDIYAQVGGSGFTGLNSTPIEDGVRYEFEVTNAQALTGIKYFETNKTTPVDIADGASVATYFNVAEGVYTAKAADTCNYILQLDYVDDIYTLNVLRAAPELSLWLKRGSSDWVKLSGLIPNPEHTEQYMVSDVELLEGDEFVIRVSGNNYIKTVTGGGAAANFDSTSGNIVVNEGKGGHYDLYIYGDELTSLNIETHVVPVTYAATINSINVENLESYAIKAGDNVWAYQFNDLAAGAVIAFTADSSAINFCHWVDGDPGHAENDGNTYTVQAGQAGNYRFFYKDGEGIYVSKVSYSTVSFNVNYGTSDSMYIVGDFNDWTPSAEYRLAKDSSSNWTGEKVLEVGAKFKLVIAPTESPTKSNIVAWEADPNRTVTGPTMSVTAWQA